MPSQTDIFIRTVLGLAGPLRPLVAPFLAPIIGAEYLAGVQYHDDTPDVYYQQSPGASSSSDPMPISVLGSGVHRYLTLADIARLQQVSQTAQQEINAHGGANYVQSLLDTDVGQLSPVILNELILMGQPIQLPNGAFLNRLSDAAFQRYMAQQTNLHANDIIGLDRHHIGLLTHQQFFSAFNNSAGTETAYPVGTGFGGFWLRMQDAIRAQASPMTQAQSDLVRDFLSMHYDYVQTHPLAGVAPIDEHNTAVNSFGLLGYNQHRDEARRLSVVPEDIADNTQTRTYLDVNEFNHSREFLQTQLETASDHDWIAVVLLKGSTYTLRMNKLGGNLDTFLTLRDSGGNEITHNDDSDGTLNSRITFTAEKSDVYFLDASSYASRSSGSYEIRSNLDVGVLDINSQYTSALTADKKNQLYKLELKSGHRYEFQMNKEPTGPYFDAYLYLRDTNKNEITHDDDSGKTFNRDSRIVYTALSDGVYYLDATSYNQNSVGKYTVVSHQVI